MSSEIIHSPGGNATSSTNDNIPTIQPWDLFDLRTAWNLEVSSAHLIGGDYHTREYLASEKGHKYVKLLNPTLESVKPLLDKIKEPSVLLLRGCELLLQSPGFPFDKFKSITTLEISGCPHLAILPENTISQMTQLENLDLSHLQIDQLPNDMFVNIQDTLRSLCIRRCSNLHVLPELRHPLDMLEYLELSHLPIETVPDGFTSERLRSLSFRGCSKLHSCQFESVTELIFLDLCYCTSLRAEFSVSNCEVIDLSYTTFDWEHVPSLVTHLFFRNSELGDPINFMALHSLKVCDLSGSQGLGDVSKFGMWWSLEALNLSRTAIEFIDFLSELNHLRTLVLRECTMLKQLPSIEQLETLEVLDLSGCEILSDLPQGLSKQRRLKELNLSGCKGLTELMEGLFDDMLYLEKLDLSNTNIMNLPSFTNLINSGTVINHQCYSVLESTTLPTELSNITDFCSDNVDSRQEIHIVSNFICNSGFDNFKYNFTELNKYLLFLEEKITKSVVNTEVSGVQRRFQSMHADLEYILGKVDLLESSPNCRSSDEVLHQLMSYDYHNYDDDPSSILKKLLRTVAKVKVLIHPPPPPPPPRPQSVGGGRKILPSSIREEKQIDDYESLTTIQRNCLLYFVCLPLPKSKEKLIKGSILIHLWYGEGFFDTLLYPNSTGSVIPETGCGCPPRNDPDQQVPTTYPNSTIMKIGRGILCVLRTKDFISLDRGQNKWYVIEPNTLFLITKAMEEHSFGFNKHGKLTPHFGVSRRACLLKSDIDHPPSSRVWLNYTNSDEKLKSFKNVHTLLYIDEHVVDIKTEWFSCMTNLHVLHLVNLCSEQQINIVDLNFLEELKKIKQLRLLNLDSFAAIQKLPDSICELTNLRILNLAYCSNLMELPTGISSLTSLIILDLTQCHLLSELPKGLGSLSKLEVLKGFAITYKVSGKQSRKACTLKELLKLEKLRKLSIVVNKDSFPNTREHQVLRSMKELRNLKITWKTNIYKEEESVDAVEEGALKQSRWKPLKCWVPQNETEDELLLTNNNLGNLNKLVLCCFPFKTAPNWLHPTELPNLERLYIEGGSPKTLLQDFTDQTTWNVKALKPYFLIQLVSKDNFPHLGSRQEHDCPYFKEIPRPRIRFGQV